MTARQPRQSSTTAIVDRGDVGQRLWNSFVDAQPDAWLWDRYELQEPGFADREVREDKSFAVVDEADRIVATVACHLVEEIGRRGNLRLLWSEGVVIDAGLATPLRAAVGQRLVGRLRSLAIQGHANEIRLARSPLAPSELARGDGTHNPLNDLARGRDASLLSWVVDLRGSRDAVWQAIRPQARGHIRRAARLGVTVRPAEDDDIPAYIEMHRETYAGSGRTPPPDGLLVSTWTAAQKGLAVVWIADCAGRAVAGGAFGMYKGSGSYWTGASTHEGRNVAAGYLVQWAAMQNMLELGYDWCETGEAVLDGTGKNRDISEFKKSFGGLLRPIPRVRLAPRRSIEAGRRTAEAGRRLVRFVRR
jgi:hypothetical protein